MGIPVSVIPQGFNQATAAMQAVLAQGVRGVRSSGPRRRRKAKSRKASATGRRTRRVRRSKPMRLVKGSAAAKRYMAKIRRKRRR